ncbi:MAG: enoyl-CoA hydratase/isomerase family protein [Vulcanimicrobiaceae bacterium]
MVIECEHVRTERRGAVGRITLDRPERLNALTIEMIRTLDGVLAAWERDPTLRVVVLAGAGRAFCAGGDVRVLYDDARAGRRAAAETLWAEEYRLDARIAAYPKPIVALMTGIVMGGGIGLSAYARVRVVTDSTRLAMPEVNIGLIPDVGATALFARAPGEVGTYLALTGASFGAADAIALGFADTYVAGTALDAFVDDILAVDRSGDDAIAAVVAQHARPPGDAPLMRHRSSIDRAFAHDRIADICDALNRDGSPFAEETLRQILEKSPTSVTVALHALREARDLDLHGALALEYRVMHRLVGTHDFFEGVRAVVVDREHRPAWQPAALADVSPDAVARCFASLGSDELRFHGDA